MYLIGQALHLLLIKIPELKELSRTNNYNFKISQWWQQDWNIIIGSALLGPSLLIGLDQLIKIKPWIEDIAVWMFWGVGILGSMIAMRFSKYSKIVMGYLDIKANISDATTGRTENKTDLIEKGIEATGTDVTKSTIKYNT
jgi:hypothetical protein